MKRMQKEKEYRIRNPDYGVCHFSKKEWGWYGGIYLCLDGMISYLFFQSAAAFLLLLPGCFLFFRDRKERILEQRMQEMQQQFLTGMQLVSASLQAGYAVENAFAEACKELEKVYEKDSFILQEFTFLVSQVHLNRSLETLLLNLGERSHVEDIQNFAEVFGTAKRTGGDLMAIIQNTVSCIRQKQETQMEIVTNLSGKQMEQNLMSVIPLFLLGYIKLTSPGFLDVMYHNLFGNAVMCGSFILYLIAYFWGRKIMHIEV